MVIKATPGRGRVTFRESISSQAGGSVSSVIGLHGNLPYKFRSRSGKCACGREDRSTCRPIGSGRNRRASIKVKSGEMDGRNCMWASTSRSRSIPGAISISSSPSGPRRKTALSVMYKRILAALLGERTAVGYLFELRDKFREFAFAVYDCLSTGP